MEPNAVLMDLLDALWERDLDRVRERTEDLTHWLNMRGYEPDWAKCLKRTTFNLAERLDSQYIDEGKEESCR